MEQVFDFYHFFCVLKPFTSVFIYERVIDSQTISHCAEKMEMSMNIPDAHHLLPAFKHIYSGCSSPHTAVLSLFTS